MVLTPHHILLLVGVPPAQCSIYVLSRINHHNVTKLPLNPAKYGVPKRLVRDVVGDRLYLITDQRIHEVTCDNESANVWSLYLQKQDFESALRLCPPECQDVVKVTQAEHFCSKGDYV